MAQQEGPFSEYLQQAKLAPPMEVPKPTGLEGTGAGIANIAMNFINGLRQGRMQKYAMQQMEEQKKYDAYQHAIQTVAASDLPDQQKKLLHAQLSTPLIQRIAGDKEATSKHTGNPLTDVLKNMAVGLVGGPGPKKMDLPMEPVVEALRMASDPSLSKTRLVADLDRQADELIRGGMEEAFSKGKAASYETFFSGDRGSKLRALIDKARLIGSPLPTVEKTRSEYRPANQEEIAKQKRIELAEGIKSRMRSEGYQPSLLDLETLHIADGLRHPVSKEGMYLTKEGEHARGYFTQSPYLNQGRPVVIGEDNKPLDYVRPVGASERISPAELKRVTAKPIQRIMSIPGVPVDLLKGYADRVESAAEIVNPQEIGRAQADAVKFGADYRDKVAKEKAADVAFKNKLSEQQKDRLEKIFKTITSDDKYKWKSVYDNVAKPVLANAGKPLNYTEQAKNDILLIRAIAKLTDITTGVREGEYRTFSELQSRYGQLAQDVKNVFGEDGQAKQILTKQARDAYMRQLEALNQNATSEYIKLLARAQAEAKEMGVDPGAINRVFKLGDIEAATSFKKQGGRLPFTENPPGGGKPKKLEPNF